MTFRFRRGRKQDDVIVDRVTGAFNRRQLDAYVAQGIDTSDQPTATLMIDVDDFSVYNGKKGVASGDRVLERVSWVIMATVRTTDVVYRHGPSSFCVLLPATSDDDALAVADRIRGNVQQMPLLAESRVTVSVGVATGSGRDLATTIERADAALAAGGRSGPNQVFAEDSMTSSRPAPRPATSQDSGLTPSPVLSRPTPQMPPPQSSTEAISPPPSTPFAPPSV
ncbi:MAG: GGDEF domain-containing protein [Ilumatobacter sp.]|uniref:GGDEF domain-containing protein n=1 Tax=Ilumatobacter sp. TaxID=1967498 RepID=UPI00329A5757